MRVLVATGGSPDAKAAVKWLLRFPLPRATEVLVLAVAPVPHSPLDPEAMREMREASRARARRAQSDACSWRRTAGARTPSTAGSASPSRFPR